MVVALVLAVAVIFLNLPQLFIIVLSALAGAGMILTGTLLALGRVSLTELNLGLVGALSVHRGSGRSSIWRLWRSASWCSYCCRRISWRSQIGKCNEVSMRRSRPVPLRRTEPAP